MTHGRLFLALCMLRALIACGGGGEPPNADAGEDLSALVVDDLLTHAPDIAQEARDLLQVNDLLPVIDLTTIDLTPLPPCQRLADGVYVEVTKYSRPAPITGRYRLETRSVITVRGNKITRATPTGDELYCDTHYANWDTCLAKCCVASAASPMLRYSAMPFSEILFAGGTCTSPSGNVWTVDQIFIE